MSVKQLSLFDEEPNKFFNRKRSWSAAKHRIILKYIQAHCYNLGGSKSFQSKYINYVDGFAGAGKYDQGIGIENFVNESDFWKRYKTDFLDTDASPLIALKLSKIFGHEERVTLRCFYSWWGKLQQESRRILKKIADKATNAGNEVRIRQLSGLYADICALSKDDLQLDCGGNPEEALTCLRVYARINQEDCPGRVIFRSLR